MEWKKLHGGILFQVAILFAMGVQEAEQSDDLTMMCMQYRGKEKG